jgi:hypothetical protein
MQSAIYFAFVRGREGEVHAIQRLSPLACARMTVVVDLPLPKPDSPKSLEEHVVGIVSGVATAWDHRFPIYFDMTRYAPDLVNSKGRPLVEHVFDCARQSRLLAVPVSGPLTERGPGTEYIAAVTAIAARDRRGAALRISHADFSDSATLKRELDAGLAALSLSASDVDLFLDAESLEFIPAGEATEAELLATLIEVATFLKTYSFRNIVFTGSSVPESLASATIDQPLKIARSELRVWKELARRVDLPLIRFGDTGIWNPRQPDTGGGGGGPPPARVRIPVGDEQVYFRAAPNLYRQLCKAAMAYPGARSLVRCWGLDTVERCGLGSGDVEAASTWVARDTNMHMEMTVRAVEEHLRGCGRLKEIALAPVSSGPWQQESMNELLKTE